MKLRNLSLLAFALLSTYWSLIAAARIFYAQASEFMEGVVWDERAVHSELRDMYLFCALGIFFYLLWGQAWTGVRRRARWPRVATWLGLALFSAGWVYGFMRISIRTERLFGPYVAGPDFLVVALAVAGVAFFLQKSYLASRSR